LEVKNTRYCTLACACVDRREMQISTTCGLRLHCGVLLVHGELRVVSIIADTLAFLGVYVKFAMMTLAICFALVMFDSNAETPRILTLVCKGIFTIMPRISNIRVTLKLAESVGAALASLWIAHLRLLQGATFLASKGRNSRYLTSPNALSCTTAF